MTKTREVPEGFELKTVQTKTGGHVYSVEVLQATSVAAILSFYTEEGKNGEDILLKIWNAGNEQGAKQGQKSTVLEAVNAGKGVQEAEEKHRDVAKSFIQGAPRGGGGARHESGTTKKQREDLGTAVTMEIVRTGSPPSKARMEEIAKECGIDPKLLGTMS